MRHLAASKYFFWVLLMLPSAGMLAEFATRFDGAELLHPTGEFAARFMIAAMSITPLRLLLPKAGWLAWLARQRRYLGVAAFGYAALHTLFYLADKGALQPIINEFFHLGIWTGWLAFAVMVPPALTSNNWSQRLLLGRWKMLQRLVYAVAVLTLVHWIFVNDNMGAALVHFLPLAVLQAYRIWKTGIGRYRIRLQANS